MSNVRNEPLYWLWWSMNVRCHCKTAKDYPRYGGRGIKVCDRWREPKGQGFKNFIEDMGERPANPEDWNSKKPYYTLDRKDVNGNYEPSNCRWATWHEQNQNKTNNQESIGVYPNGSSWEARFRPSGKFISKTFKTKEEAIEARKQMELDYN